MSGVRDMNPAPFDIGTRFFGQRICCVDIQGIPAPSARARTFMGRGRPYTPKKTRAAMHWNELQLLEERPACCPINGPLALVLEYWLPTPQGRVGSKAKRAAMARGEIMPTVKPDLDNLVKLTKDSLTRAMYWKDDKQVCATVTIKAYTASLPKVRVQVFAVDNWIRVDGGIADGPIEGACYAIDELPF